MRSVTGIASTMSGAPTTACLNRRWDVKRVRLVDGERNLDHSFAVADPTAVALSGGSVIAHEHRKGENCRDRREVCGHASGCATPNAAQRRTGAQRNPTP